MNNVISFWSQQTEEKKKTSGGGLLWQQWMVSLMGGQTYKIGWQYFCMGDNFHKKNYSVNAVVIKLYCISVIGFSYSIFCLL